MSKSIKVSIELYIEDSGNEEENKKSIYDYIKDLIEDDSLYYKDISYNETTIKLHN